jgi:hypothetical protein
VSRPASLALGAVVLAVCGCASHVEWRPDSNGFYYSRADGRIVEYDLEKKSSREVARVDVGERKDAFPNFDLHPDGKRLVLAESTSLGNDTQLVRTKLRVVDLAGQTEKSTTLEWRATEGKQSDAHFVATFAEWSPTAKHVLIATENAIAVWDVEQGAIRPHEGLRPLLPLYLGVSPWRPDGRALLALGRKKEVPQADDDPEDLVLVRVDGSVEAVEIGSTPGGEGSKTVFPREGPKNSIPRGEWQGNELVSTIGDQKVTIDTNALTARTAAIEAKPVHEYALGKATLRFDTGEEQPEIVWRRDDETISLGNTFGAAFTLAGGPVVVSPDGKRAVVVRQKDLVIVDETGIVRTLNTVGGDDGVP